MDPVIIAISVFILVYICLSFELINKAVAALLGVMVLLLTHVLSEHEAFSYVDSETILLLLGMMIIVGITKETGIFTYASVKIADLTKGNPLKILVMFSLLTAVMSAFLDNVTTVLIIIPIIIELTKGMGLDPKIYVISQAIISNIGGTSTLIGDPPNIIIGSKVGLTFNQFIANLIIPVLISLAIALVYMYVTNKQSFKPINNNLPKLFTVHMLLEKIRAEFAQTKMDRVFLAKCILVLVITVLLFVTQTVTGITPGITAVTMAMVLFIISKTNVEKLLEEVEWSTLLFFVGLFILVGALEHYGVLEWIATNIFLKLNENPYVLVLAILWVSGIASGFLDNIPFTVTMIPIIQILQAADPLPNNILWWALSLGACFGGNLTMIGASANIVSVGIAKKFDVHISFWDFMKHGAVITFISLIISSIYLSIYLYLVL